MNTEKKFNPEILRPLKDIFEPDPRSTCYSTIDREKGWFRPLTIKDRYEAVSQINLNKMVPKEILIQFETTKNLYLYAWFIYRFHPVAEHQAFVCLELALRTRYEKEILENRSAQAKKPKNKQSRNRTPTLTELLGYAIEKGDIKNEGFKEWHKAVKIRAHSRYSKQKSEEMREKGLDQIILNYSKAEISAEDRNINYVKILLETIPENRNLYAHGTEMLHDKVLGTIDSVSEIINQIYPEK